MKKVTRFMARSLNRAASGTKYAPLNESLAFCPWMKLPRFVLIFLVGGYGGYIEVADR